MLYVPMFSACMNVYPEPLFQMAPEGTKRLMATTQMSGTSRVCADERGIYYPAASSE
jgi:hypothetical protein